MANYKFPEIGEDTTWGEAKLQLEAMRGELDAHYENAVMERCEAHFSRLYGKNDDALSLLCYVENLVKHWRLLRDEFARPLRRIAEGIDGAHITMERTMGETARQDRIYAENAELVAEGYDQCASLLRSLDPVRRKRERDLHTLTMELAGDVVAGRVGKLPPVSVRPLEYEGHSTDAFSPEKLAKLAKRQAELAPGLVKPLFDSPDTIDGLEMAFPMTAAEVKRRHQQRYETPTSRSDQGRISITEVVRAARELLDGPEVGQAMTDARVHEDKPLPAAEIKSCAKELEPPSAETMAAAEVHEEIHRQMEELRAGYFVPADVQQVSGAPAVLPVANGGTGATDPQEAMAKVSNDTVSEYLAGDDGLAADVEAFLADHGEED